MNTTAIGRSTLSEKYRGTYFQESGHVRIKRTKETGRINAADGGVVHMLMDATNELKLFSASVCSGHAFAGSCVSNANDWQDEH
jgi:hypothetical protein